MNIRELRIRADSACKRDIEETAIASILIAEPFAPLIIETMFTASRIVATSLCGVGVVPFKKSSADVILSLMLFSLTRQGYCEESLRGRPRASCRRPHWQWGRVCTRLGTVEQASAIAGGADGERFALFVIWVFALCVALLDRFDALDASECRLFDLSRDGTADTVDRALRRLAFEDRRSEGQGYECSEGGELHVGMN